MNQLTEAQRQAIHAEILGERKISAIKLYREATGVGLKEAKDAVEDMEKDLRQRAPGKFARGGKKSGCLSVVAVLALIGTAFVTVYILRS